ncbi:DUF488 family protein [Sulfitobacter aestuarii]|uniref:DUF488 family protein n=1 Tax=Sulfitobacter aestuarii TaxID=2161676 RepID=A0ABW5U211_9RHOB
MSGGFFSIGHSNRDLETVIEMLRENRITLLIDVRSFPRSRNNPGFNIDTFPDLLAQYQIGYRHMPDLGGRRPKQPEVPDETNAMWRLRSFHNYADYALGEAFQTAFQTLLELGREQRVAMMCSEAVWWRCHRRIITDYLLLNGHEVTHIMAPGRADAAKATDGACKCDDDRVVYPETA